MNLASSCLIERKKQTLKREALCLFLNVTGVIFNLNIVYFCIVLTAFSPLIRHEATRGEIEAVIIIFLIIRAA